MTFHLKFFTVLFCLTTFTNVLAQSKKDSDIFGTLKAKDSLLFEVGFNQCNLSQIEQLVTDDIEFYHDQDGITTSKKAFIASIKNNLCNSGSNILNRVLEEASFEVFPLYREGNLYGAIQNGTHVFGQTQASYSHLWLLKKQEWKLSRVLSYNHQKQQDVSKNKRLDISVNDLQQYVGEYEFSPEFVLTIQIKNGQLYGGSQGQDVQIFGYSEHKFIDDEQTHDLEFLLDERGNVASLLMKGDGMEMTAQKR